MGSPPRVRGKAKTTIQEKPMLRITPACAGKSVIFGEKNIIPEDHPRVCGEKHCAGDGAAVYRGSPPRVRGKACNFFKDFLVKRITPACAGKSPQKSGRPLSRKDHPRVCGEKQAPFHYQKTPSGSPPRVRGKDLLDAAQQAHPGITPACAGKRLKKARRYAIFSFEQHTIPLVSHKAAAPICSPPPPCGREN